MSNSYRAHRLLNIMKGVPIVWADNREVVQVTFEKADYAELLSLLASLDVAPEQPSLLVGYRRVKI